MGSNYIYSGKNLGKILQVAQVTYDTPVTVTSDTYANTGLSASIVPKSTSSKILVLVSQFITVSNSGESAGGGLRLLRDSTEIYNPSYSDATGDIILWNQSVGSGATSTIGRSMISFMYLDSPATTSSVSYKTQIRRYTTGHSITAQQEGATATITLIEVAE